MEMVNPKRYRIHPNVTEVGCERQNQPSNAQCLQLNGPNIQPRHCVIAHTEGIVTVTPCSRDAETYVGGQRIFETTILQVSFCVWCVYYFFAVVVRLGDGLGEQQVMQVLRDKQKKLIPCIYFNIILPKG
jgi:hypothetical protein